MKNYYQRSSHCPTLSSSTQLGPKLNTWILGKLAREWIVAKRVYGTTKLCDYVIFDDGDCRRAGGSRNGVEFLINLITFYYIVSLVRFCLINSLKIGIFSQCREKVLVKSLFNFHYIKKLFLKINIKKLFNFYNFLLIIT